MAEKNGWKLTSNLFFVPLLAAEVDGWSVSIIFYGQCSTNYDDNNYFSNFSVITSQLKKLYITQAIQAIMSSLKTWKKRCIFFINKSGCEKNTQARQSNLVFTDQVIAIHIFAVKLDEFNTSNRIYTGGFVQKFK